MPVNTAQEIIEVKAPQFASDPRLQDLISLSEAQTGTIFGKNYNLAVALRVCHWLALEQRNGGDSGVSDSGSGISGFISSEKEGDLSRSYKTQISENSHFYDLSTTTYGVELYRLIKGTMISVRNRFV